MAKPVTPQVECRRCGRRIPATEALAAGWLVVQKAARPQGDRQMVCPACLVAPPQPVEATPEAAELAAEHGLDLAEIPGSGTDGRILVGDVKAALQAVQP